MAVEITAPDNTKTNFTFPADAAPYFQHVYASFGMQQGNDGYGGQYVVFSHAGISSPYSIDDSFTNSLPDASFSLAGPQYGAQIVPPGSVLYDKWLLPASGFTGQISPDLRNWVDAGQTNTWNFAGYGWLPLAKADLPGTGQNYFRMIKRVATQLQVLLPGETNAPGTVSGKIGTPTNQKAGVAFDITVNACDSTWHVVSSVTDKVSFSSTDPGAGLPFDTALVNGTKTIVAQTALNAGTWTVTATDVTADSTIAAATSSPIVVDP
jgi:hypothetical protein